MDSRGRPLVAPWLLSTASLLVVGGCKPSPTVRLDPPSWNFGTVAYGDQVSQNIAITNTSGYDLQVTYQGTAAGEQGQLIGLPISDLKPGQTAQIQFIFRPAYDLRYQQSASVQSALTLVVGGYSGSVWGDASSEVTFDVTGQIATVDAGPTCNPGPNGDSSGVGGSLGQAAGTWDQQGYACVSATPADGGTTCQSPADCTAFCCACPSDCAGFTAGACVLGTCAPATVACDLVQSLTSTGPVLCPDGGSHPSSVLGALGFSVGASGSRFDTSLTVNLALSSSLACLQTGTLPGLSLVLPGSPAIQPGLFEVGAAQATLDEQSTGELNASGGYVLLSAVSATGASGSFDLQFGAGAANEVWGAFNAPICP